MDHSLDVGEFEVEDILDDRIKLGHTQYLVKWKLFPKSEATWEPADCLTQCPAIIAAYNKRVQRTGRPSRDKPLSRQKQRREPRPIPDQNAAEYEIQAILADRTIGGVLQYLTRGDGPGADADEWLPATALHCPRLIADYERKKKRLAKESPIPSAETLTPKMYSGEDLPEGVTVSAVVGVFLIENELRYHVHLSNDHFWIVTSRFCNKNCIHKLIDFLQTFVV
jgi:hypothetical protein